MMSEYLPRFEDAWPALAALGVRETWHERGMLERLAVEINRINAALASQPFGAVALPASILDVDDANSGYIGKGDFFAVLNVWWRQYHREASMSQQEGVKLTVTTQQLDMLMVAVEAMARQHTGRMAEAYKRLADMLRLARV